VVILETQGFDAVPLAEILRRERYDVQTLSTEDVNQLQNDPPHIVVCYWERVRSDLRHTIEELHAQLPESHIVLMVPLYDIGEVYEIFSSTIYDCVPYPTPHSQQLIMAMDRAAERDFFMYACEQRGVALPPPTEAPKPAPEPATETPLARFKDFNEHLFRTRSLEEAIDVTLDRWQQAFPQAKVVFFKYFANRRSLVFMNGRGIKRHSAEGAGVNLNEREENFKVHDLKTPERIGVFVDMIQHVFGAIEFQTWLLELNEAPVGVMVILEDPRPLQKNAEAILILQLLHSHLKLIDTERRLHVVSARDEITEVLHRQSFLEGLHAEVARARRTQLPVSLILVKIDQMPNILKNFGRDEADLMLKMIAKIFRRHSRVNDIVGRTGSDEFGLLLPHTPHQGAAVKAERVRRMIESANFSKLIKSVDRVTVSCGVSEYPTLCRDADDLLSSSDSALYEVVRTQSNKVCIATAPIGFVADFVVPEPVWLEAGRLPS
jgi:diguanylate cyclase (GGDEF)-like protein